MIYYNGIRIDFNQFPNKEKYLDIVIKDDKNHLVVFKYEGDETLMELFFFMKEFKRQQPNAYVELGLAYMPYSRMDRQQNIRIFSLKYVAELINSMGFSKVYILEPHSDTTCALVHNSERVSVVGRLLDYAVRSRLIDFDSEEDFIMLPDAGAEKNFAHIGAKNICIGIKKRDFDTGRITDYSLHIPPGKDIFGKNVVIIDDLCSKGGTFVWAGELLYHHTPKSVSLITAHMEETVYEGEILTSPYIEKIVTTDSIISKKGEGSSKMMIVGFDNFIPTKETQRRF